jgi:glycosyltransferase involved in cell wall biosynthesis
MDALVSIIIPTKNVGKILDTCLNSIKKQTYPNIETIIVDSFSMDDTVEIASKYKVKFLQFEHNMAGSRNYGAMRSNGNYLYFIDGDMELRSDVVTDCVNKLTSSKCDGCIIPEHVAYDNFFGKIRALEKSLYIGEDRIENARFFRREAFIESGIYDEELRAYEDREICIRMQKKGYKVNCRSAAFVIHHEEKKKIVKHLKKIYLYSKSSLKYLKKQPDQFYSQMNPVYRIGIFFKKDQLFKHPVLIVFAAMLKMLEYIVTFVAVCECIIKKYN